MWFPVRKLGKKFWTLLILLFVLSLGAQALGLISVYFSAALIGAFLLLAVLLEGWRCGVEQDAETGYDEIVFEREAV